MVSEKDDNALADPAMNEWLKGKKLGIKALLNLARGAHPVDDWPPPKESVWFPRWRRLKDEIADGNLKASYATPIPEKHAIVSLFDLWAFATGPVGQGDAWQWARDFCKRWADVCGEVLPQSKPTEKRHAGEPKPQTVAGRKEAHDEIERSRQILGDGCTDQKAADHAALDSDKSADALLRARRHYITHLEAAKRQD